MKITVINEKESLKIIDSRKPKGLFITREGDIYIGIDNSTGEAWTEEFNTESECREWLKRG